MGASVYFGGGIKWHGRRSPLHAIGQYVLPLAEAKGGMDDLEYQLDAWSGPASLDLYWLRLHELEWFDAVLAMMIAGVLQPHTAHWNVEVDQKLRPAYQEIRDKLRERIQQIKEQGADARYDVP